jgi:hypothetical protein
MSATLSAYGRVPRHMTRRLLSEGPGELSGADVPAGSMVLRPTATAGAAFTEVGSADVCDQVTIHVALFIRKSSVWMAHRGRGPGRVSRIIDATARRSQSSTRHLSDGFMPDPSWSAADGLSQSGTPPVELVAMQRRTIVRHAPPIRPAP